MTASRLINITCVLLWTTAFVMSQQPAMAQQPKPQPPPPIDCRYVRGDVHLEQLVRACGDETIIQGDSYLILDGAKEHDIHYFFEKIKQFQMGIRIWAHPRNPPIVDLGAVEILGNYNPKIIGLWIENTNVEKVLTKNLTLLRGIRVKGNKFLENETLIRLSKAEDDTQIVDLNKTQPFIRDKIRYRRIQPYGECNIDNYNNQYPNFTECTQFNNLILNDKEKIPKTFKPIDITGCIVVQYAQSDHDWMASVRKEEIHNFECTKFGLEAAGINGIYLGINRNYEVCLKEDTAILNISQVATLRNGNPECAFRCVQQDISERGQRFCVHLDGDLIIDNHLADYVNITEVTMSLKRIEGAILIADLWNLKLSSGLDYIDLRALEVITGGDTYHDAVITVMNSTISTIMFENLTVIRGYNNAFEVHNDNPKFNMSEDILFMVETAANGREVIIEEYKAPLMEAEEEYEYEYVEEEDNSTELGLLIGLPIGGVLLLLVLVAVGVAVGLHVKKTREKKTKKGKKGDKDAEKEKLLKNKEINPSVCAGEVAGNTSLQQIPIQDGDYENMAPETTVKPSSNYENMPVTTRSKAPNTKPLTYENIATAAPSKVPAKTAAYHNMATAVSGKAAPKEETYENMAVVATSKPAASDANYENMSKISHEADGEYENMAPATTIKKKTLTLSKGK